MEEEQVVAPPEGQNGDAPESEQVEQSDGLLMQDREELSERVSHLEKRIREQQDEIVCLKGAMADVMRRIGQVESTKTQNSVLPSKPYLQSPRRTPAGKERPRSVTSESSSSRSSAPTSARQPPRGSSAASSSVKRWGSMSNSIEDTNGHKTPRSGSQLTSAKRSSSQGALHLKSTLTTKGSKGPAFDGECVRMYLKGRPVPLYLPTKVIGAGYDLNEKPSEPDEKPTLEWVYGYRGRDARSNLYPLSTGEIVYFHAAVVVLYNLETDTQRHYLEHTDDIKCIAIHPHTTVVATGQVAGHEKKDGKIVPSLDQKPHIRVWETTNLNTLCTFGEKDFQRAVSCISFSSTGRLLLAVDEGNDHTLSIWDTSGIKPADCDKQPKKITEMKASGDPVTACEFHPLHDDSIVCCGKSQISFWNIEHNKLNKKMGIFEKHDKAKYIICVAYFTSAEGPGVISGDSNGTLYFWPEGSNKIAKAVENAHEGPVFSICVLEDTILTGGGKDRMVYEWDYNLERTGKQAEIPERYGAVRMISESQGKVFVGTIRNCILQSTMNLEFRPVVEGHKEELWGLCTLPDTHQFMTCGYDGHLYLWDAQSHSAVWVKEISEPAHCCAVYKYGKRYVAAIGNRTGNWMAMDLETKEIRVCNDGKEQHECVEFSPDGSMLAFGNRDNYIYVYKSIDEGRKFSLLGRCKGHSSYITHIDWSDDSKYIRSNSGDYEILYWEAETRKRIGDDLRDQDFATNNCTLSFNTLGIWPDGADGTDINACSTAHDTKKTPLIASADDFGKLKLYRYPCNQHLAESKGYQAHSSHVTGVRFLFDDSRIISTGGKDMAIMQWSLK